MVRLNADLPDDEKVPEPTIDDWLMWVWRAWSRLNLDRPYIGGGMSSALPGRIPWRDVVLWGEVHGLSPEDLDFLDHCVIAMDSAFLEATEQKRKAAENAGG